MPDHMTIDLICFCRIFLSLGKKANNRQRLATAHSPTVPMFSIKLSCTAGSPPQVWWVAVRKYHYRPEKLFAFCSPQQNLGAACTAQPKLSSRRRLFAPSSGELYLSFGCSIVKVRILHLLYVSNVRARAVFAALRSFLFP